MSGVVEVKAQAMVVAMYADCTSAYELMMLQRRQKCTLERVGLGGYRSPHSGAPHSYLDDRTTCVKPTHTHIIGDVLAMVAVAAATVDLVVVSGVACRAVRLPPLGGGPLCRAGPHQPLHARGLE